MRIDKTVVLAMAMALAASAASAGTTLQVSYPSDAGLDCAGLAAEIAKTEATIAQANRDIAGADGQTRAAGLANTVAVEGMLRTGVLARAPGLGMFANQAASVARQQAAARQAEAAEVIRVSETRRAMLTGIVSGKGCGQAPAPAATPTLAAAGPAR
jgi:hypothetical protein